MSSESEMFVGNWPFHESDNTSVLLYHLVLHSQYRRVVIDDEAVDTALREVCLEIAGRYDIDFLEIGTDGEHVHFLLQSVPSLSVSKIVRIVQSLTAREVLTRCPHIKKKLWGGPLWADDYFVCTVSPPERQSEKCFAMPSGGIKPPASGFAKCPPGHGA